MKRLTRGRPRVEDADDTVRVEVTLPAYQYDYLYATARRTEVSVPEVIRRRLQLAAANKPRRK
jgi:hypothetical protein